MPDQDGTAPKFRRPWHRLVGQVLESLNGELLARARCWFGGGTRVAMELGEFRESVAVDFLCADRVGYRVLRSTVTQSLLGDMASRALDLMRDIRADMYGIRTFLRVDGQPVKFEIIFEGRIPLTGEARSSFPVEVLSRVQHLAEASVKVLQSLIERSARNPVAQTPPTTFIEKDGIVGWLRQQIGPPAGITELLHPTE